MKDIKIKIIIKHNYPFFQEEKLLKRTIDMFQAEKDEIHLTKSLAVIVTKPKEEKEEKISIFIDKDIIQFNVKLNSNLLELSDFIKILSQEEEVNLEPSLMIVESSLEMEPELDTLNNLLKNSEKFNLQMVGLDFNGKECNYKISVVNKKEDLRLIFRTSLPSRKDFNLENLEKETNITVQEIYDEVLPSLREFIEG
ncbi:hypothetical protein ACQCT3_02550 [Sutcliffiella horikoshii]|uniref:hypothetical protein n=1 Tax=Sutcliffiella horikoshii TaxID=79883 RepID=UPI003CE89E16